MHAYSSNIFDFNDFKKSCFERVQRHFTLLINRIKKRESSAKFLIYRLIIFILSKNERISN